MDYDLTVQCDRYLVGKHEALIYILLVSVCVVTQLERDKHCVEVSQATI